jgi:CheY-like chemotaxis protein
MATTKKRILCVDDNPDDCELIKTYLGREDIEVVIVGTLAEALSKAKSEHFDLYLIDESLPCGSGIELTLKIRKFDRTTPIIFHSALGPVSVIEKAMKAGAQKFIEKQIDFDDVVRAIKTYLCGKGIDIEQNKDGP